MTATPAAHPACHKLIAIAIGQQMEEQYPDGRWLQCSGDDALVNGYERGWDCIRIAPGQPGYVTRTVCYPEPLKVMPEDGIVLVLTPEGVGSRYTTLGVSKGYFRAGLCYPATPEGEAHAREAWQARFGGERG